MRGWLAANVARIAIVLLIALALAGALVVRSCRESRTATTIAKVASGQAAAATASGTDAVNTVGNRMAADTASDRLTKENDDAIRSAEGADAPVAAPVHNAGLAGLCRRAAYRGDRGCVQHADP